MGSEAGTMKVSERDLVFFDTELTGFEPDKEIIELGFVKVRGSDLSVLHEQAIKIIPTRLESANTESLKFAGYDPKVWAAEGRPLAIALAEFLNYTKECLLVGHNLPIDWMHLHNSLLRVKMEPNFWYKGLDTFSFAYQKLRGNPKFSKFSLTELAEYFGVDMGTHHRALDDARTTYGVFKKLTAL